MLSKLALTLAVLAVAATGEAQLFRATHPKTHKIAICGTKGFVHVDVSMETASALCNVLPDRVQQGMLPSFYRVPGIQNRFLVTADHPSPSPTNYGLAVWVFRHNKQGMQQLFVGEGMQDSYMLRPTIFVGTRRTLILAEAGDETGTWGVAVIRGHDAKSAVPRSARCST